MSTSPYGEHAKYMRKWLHEVSNDVDWLRSRSESSSSYTDGRLSTAEHQHESSVLCQQLGLARLPEGDELRSAQWRLEKALEKVAVSLRLTRNALEIAEGERQSRDKEVLIYTPKCYDKTTTGSSISTDASSEEMAFQSQRSDQSTTDLERDEEAMACMLPASDPPVCDHASPFLARKADRVREWFRQHSHQEAGIPS
eukprot:gnl/TRDRNA2_/TRDRNA2_62023_c0_seq1.p1 gnl/TRDRNA2_/TRDRNA2_62023_c0~~gnl/TRDRNA2_/TRDRNA2_62023_c0_seq1.p1  ORF type:complete len:198 (-),score=27.15 gnl/TRDRNA2_/TRDRNA2_62023_c0_seq1:162-755(-)